MTAACFIIGMDFLIRLVIKKGKVPRKSGFQIQGEVISSIKYSLIKCQGKCFYASLNPGGNVVEAVK